ncbi:MAG: Spy/CpxP family protein refolding chaperone [Candidatus Pacebacteria bacterium]|nr:Spy/CpxP family protein refolding chaperone [Candidatus Paceibacterota bacterium]
MMIQKTDQTQTARKPLVKWYRNWKTALTVLTLVLVLPVLSGCNPFDDDRDMSKTFSQQVDKRLASLRDRLKITAEQTPQWDKFAATVKTEGQTVADRHRDLMRKSKSDSTTGTAIDHLEGFQTMMEANMISMNRVIESAKPLYAVLNPEQKKLADKMVKHPKMGWRDGYKWFGKGEDEHHGREYGKKE